MWAERGAVTHLLDTSAVMAHFLAEPGGERVTQLLARGPGSVALAAPGWPELERRLDELIPEPAEAARIFRHYTETLCAMVPLDEAAARAAIRIRHSCPNRLPLVDALIAGCAMAAGLILVHRDSHLDAIPTAVLAVLRLPDKLRPHRRT